MLPKSFEKRSKISSGASHERRLWKYTFLSSISDASGTKNQAHSLRGSSKSSFSPSRSLKHFCIRFKAVLFSFLTTFRSDLSSSSRVSSATLFGSLLGAVLAPKTDPQINNKTTEKRHGSPRAPKKEPGTEKRASGTHFGAILAPFGTPKSIKHNVYTLLNTTQK